MFEGRPFASKIICACSGGADSLYLAYLLQRYATGSEIHAIIINHNLRKHSGEEAEKTLIELKRIGYKKIKILEWKHNGITSGIEEKARLARFDLIFSYAKTENIQDIYLGHHRGDLLENFFLKLGSGAGITGLCGLKSAKYIIWQGMSFCLLRPLLNMEKADILLKVKEEGLNFVNDESNESPAFKRNRIRKALSFALDALELSKENIYTSIKALERGGKVLEAHTLEKISKAFIFNNEYGFFCAGFDEIKTLSPEELFFILKKIIFSLTEKNVRGKNLETASLKLLNGKNFTIGGVEFFLQKEYFYIIREAFKIKEIHLEKKMEKEILWDKRFKILNLQKGHIIKRINFKVDKYTKCNLPAKIIKTLPSVWSEDTIVAFPGYRKPHFEDIEFKVIKV